MTCGVLKRCGTLCATQAKKCRERRKEYVEALQERATMLEAHNKELLKQLVLAHRLRDQHRQLPPTPPLNGARSRAAMLTQLN
jgi:hypothetical protein